MPEITITTWESQLRSRKVVDDRWRQLTRRLGAHFGRECDLDGVLFLIGIQETGRGFERDLDKSAKERLVVEGSFCAFETIGFYQRTGMETDGHWVWEVTEAMPDGLSKKEQETLLKVAVLAYFNAHYDSYGKDS